MLNLYCDGPIILLFLYRLILPRASIYNCAFSLLGRVNENVYANHTASKISSRSGMSASLVVMISGRFDDMSLKSIGS